MASANLILLALRSRACSQKELAGELGVSAAQVSKWKSGEYMSLEMQRKLKVIAEIGDRDPDVVYWTGCNEQADKWYGLIKHLASEASTHSDCSYVPYPLLEDEEFMVWKVLHSLTAAGMSIPEQFPQEIDFDYNCDYEGNIDRFEVLYYGNAYSSLIYRALKALAQLFDFYRAYVRNIIDNDRLKLFDSPACNIEPGLFDMAVVKTVKDDSSLLLNIKQFRSETLTNYRDWFELVKHRAIEHSIPLKAELMDFINDEPELLAHKAEAEALGFNSGRLHPDIYMNEILESQRVIRRVLPVICQKLGICDDQLINDRVTPTRE